jgi:hypothetical protein
VVSIFVLVNPFTLLSLKPHHLFLFFFFLLLKLSYDKLPIYIYSFILFTLFSYLSIFSISSFFFCNFLIAYLVFSSISCDLFFIYCFVLLFYLYIFSNLIIVFHVLFVTTYFRFFLPLSFTSEHLNLLYLFNFHSVILMLIFSILALKSVKSN